MSLDKKIIGGGPAPQCGIKGSTSTDTNESLSGDNALEGLAAFSYNGSYWIAQTGGQSVYLYDGQGTILNNANTSGINPQSMGFHNGSVYTYDTYQPTGSGGWKSWNVTTGTWTETDHNCNLPNVGGNAPYWHIQDPLNPARIYIGSPFTRDVYMVYYADFPSTTVNSIDTGYNIDTTISDNINAVTFDGNYFWLSEYSSSGGSFYQAYVGGSKGDPFELTGVTIPKVGGFDYYSMMAYNGYDDRLWIKRKSATAILRQIPDYGASCPTPSYMDFLCVAGGGGGGQALSDFAGGIGGGGAGAGGLRTSYGSTTGGGNTTSEGGLELIGGTYTVTIGAGGAGYTNGNNSSIAHSSLQTIESLKGGAGGRRTGNAPGGGNGTFGSGGGEASDEGQPPGAGTTGQGRDGGPTGSGVTGRSSAGGGGSATAGGAIASNRGGNGGNGTSVTITGSTIQLAGGGGGGGGGTGTIPGGTGGSGGGGNGGGTFGGGNGNNASGNTGSGGGAAGGGTSGAGSPGAGGSGRVILRLPTSQYSGTTTGSPTVTTSGSDTILTFTGSGTYVHS